MNNGELVEITGDGKKSIKHRRIATKEDKDAMMQECVDNFDVDTKNLPTNFAMILEKKYNLSAKTTITSIDFIFHSNVLFSGSVIVSGLFSCSVHFAYL